MTINRVLESCLYVDDLDAAERFYRDVLGIEPTQREADRHVFFRCGRQMVLLFNPDQTNDESDPFSVPRHGCHGRGHLAFAVRERDLEAWRARLTEHGVAIEQETTWPNGGQSLYFRDPAGNSLELATPRLWGLSEE